MEITSKDFRRLAEIIGGLNRYIKMFSGCVGEIESEEVIQVLAETEDELNDFLYDLATRNES